MLDAVPTWFLRIECTPALVAAVPLFFAVSSHYKTYPHNLGGTTFRAVHELLHTYIYT